MKINPVTHLCPECVEIYPVLDEGLDLIETLPLQVCQSCFGLIDISAPYITRVDIEMRNGDMLDAFGQMDVDQLETMCVEWFGPDDHSTRQLAENLHTNIQMIAIHSLVWEEVQRLKKENPL